MTTNLFVWRSSNIYSEPSLRFCSLWTWFQNWCVWQKRESKPWTHWRQIFNEFVFKNFNYFNRRPWIIIGKVLKSLWNCKEAKILIRLHKGFNIVVPYLWFFPCFFRQTLWNRSFRSCHSQPILKIFFSLLKSNHYSLSNNSVINLKVRQNGVPDSSESWKIMNCF